MPDMYTIYQQHSAQYDELVQAEDYQNNLKPALLNLVDWKDKVVYEAGIGTGRVTQAYIGLAKHVYGYDREEHMLEACAANLSDYSSKLKLATGDNLNLPQPASPVDIFIEGWSFGHSMADNRDTIPEVFKNMFSRIEEIVKPGGSILILETLGTGSEEPTIPGDALAEFYTLMEEQYGFTRHWIRSDYKYESAVEASRIMGFFFGDRMGEIIFQNSMSLIPECTGIWIKENKKI